MRRIIHILIAIFALAPSVCQSEAVSVTNDGVVITWEKTEPQPPYKEPQEITHCRQIWPDAHFRCEGGTNFWQCLVIPHPKVILLSEVLECRKAILDCGWTPTETTSAPPTEVPPRDQSSSEQFSKGNRILWFSFAEDAIKVKTQKAQIK